MRNEEIIQRMIDGNLNDFQLVYDTYTNGVARLIFDKYRMRKNEYEIEFNPSGLASGVYFIRLVTEDGVSLNKMTFAR